MPIQPLAVDSPDAVFDFLNESGAPHSRAHWAWKYSHSDPALPRAFYSTDRDGRVNGFIGLLLTTLHAGPSVYPAAWFVDWRSAPGAQAVGTGVGLLRAAQRQVEIVLTLQGSADTRRVLPHLGWHQCDTPRTWVRPLSTRYVHTVAAPRLGLPRQLSSLLNGTWWRLPTLEVPGIAIVEVDRIPETYDDVWADRRREFSALMRRDSTYLNQFCANFPEGGYTLALIQRYDRTVGAAIWRCDQDNRGLRRGRIVDIMWPRRDTRVLAATLAHVCRALAAAGADYVECLASVDELGRELAMTHFIAQRPVAIWYHTLPADVPDPKRWYVTLLDCDRAYR